MIEFNKILKKISLLSIFAVLLISCKTASIVNFESISYEKFMEGTFFIPEDCETFYFTRILTASCVNIVFLEFSTDDKNQNILIRDFTIKDDNDNTIFKKDEIIPTTTGLIYSQNNYQYKIFSYDPNTNELERSNLKFYKTNHLILEFEINGIKYKDKLKRVEKKYLVTRT